MFAFQASSALWKITGEGPRASMDCFEQRCLSAACRHVICNDRATINNKVFTKEAGRGQLGNDCPEISFAAIALAAYQKSCRSSEARFRWRAAASGIQTAG